MSDTPQQSKAWVRGSTLSAGVLLAALLLVMVNYLGWKYHQRLDWTESELYTLSEKTENVLRSLDQDIEVVVFTGPGGPNAQLVEPVLELLARYEAESPRLTVREIDPVKNIVEAQRLLEQYGTRYMEGSVKVVFDAAGDRRVFEDSDLAERDFSAMQMGGAPSIEAFKGEELFTGALVELASGEQPTVLFTTGHGERALSDFSGVGLQSFQDLLGRDNMQLDEWASLGKPEVPAGTDLVVIAGPTSSFLPPELEVFGRYLAGGGRMLWLVDPSITAEGTVQDLGLDDWLAGYGVSLADDLVVDPSGTLPFYSGETFFLSSYGSHPAVKALDEAAVPVIFSVVRSVSRGEAPPDLTVTELVRTSADGWGETNLVDLTAVEAQEGDVLGPVAVAVAVEGAGSADGDTASAPVPGLRMVVVGDADFASDSLVASAGNAAFLDNTLNWLLARESFLGIPPKRPEQVRLDLDDDQLLTIYGLVALLPLLAILGGAVVYLKRRR